MSNVIDITTRQTQRQLEQHHAEQERTASRYRKACVPRRYATCTVDGYQLSGNPQQRATWQIVKAMADDPLLNGQTPRGGNLLLAGHTGTGKTHLAAATLNAWLAAGGGGHFTSHSGMLRSIRACYDNEQISEAQAIRGYILAPLLVIDELGRTASSEWDRRILFDILDQRYADMMSTIITSNLDHDQLAKLLGAPMLRRINATGGVLRCTWPAYE